MPSPQLPILDRPIRFALVGCGRIADKHFEALHQHRDRAALVAVCDTDRVALDRAQARTGAAGFESLHELLARSNADVVVLATPSGLHAQQAIETSRGRTARDHREADGHPLA